MALCAGERPREGDRATEAGQDAANDQVERPSATATETATAPGWSRAIKHSAPRRPGEQSDDQAPWRALTMATARVGSQVKPARCLGGVLLSSVRMCHNTAALKVFLEDAAWTNEYSMTV